ncbi:hypothetical protein ABKA04_006830 [Annulohypoxylon sp. FPYF3050]
MEPDLTGFEDGKFCDYQLDTYRLIKVNLQYPAEPKYIAAKLVEDIVFLCTTPRLNGENACDIFFVWDVIIQMSRYIPPDHPWQDSLVQAVDNLRHREGSINGPNTGVWKHLPDLAMCMRENWEDGLDIDYSEGLTQEESVTITEAEMNKWKNQNSFAARLTRPDWAPWLNLPIWQLRSALEEPPLKGPVQECRVWIATEWLIRCTEKLLEYQGSGQGPLNVLKTGSLCSEDIPQLGTSRWEFWKKRLGEFAANAESFEFEGVILERISETLKRMEAAQKKTDEEKAVQEKEVQEKAIEEKATEGKE